MERVNVATLDAGTPDRRAQPDLSNSARSDQAAQQPIPQRREPR
jgi:hypothetical protein